MAIVRCECGWELPKPEREYRRGLGMVILNDWEKLSRDLQEEEEPETVVVDCLNPDCGLQVTVPWAAWNDRA